MKIKLNVNFYLVFFSFIIAWAMWLCYLVPLPINEQDITNLLVIMFFGIVIVRENMLKKIHLNKPFVYFLFILLTSATSAYLRFGQSFIDSFAVCRHMYIQYSIALPLYYLIKHGKVKRDRLYDALIMSIRIACTIYVLHFFLHTYVGIDILALRTGGQRYGSDRFYLNLVMPMFLICNAFSNIYADRFKLIDCYDALVVLTVIMLVTKMRFAAFSCVCAILIGLIIAKKLDLKKVLLLTGAVAAGTVVLFCTEMGSDFLDIIFGGNYAAAGTGAIREVGRTQHLLSFLKAPIFGMGYPHENCYASLYEFGTLNSYMIDGTEQRIYLTDNGIFDVLYIFGLSGIVWIISYFGHWLKKSVRLFKKRQLSVYFMFIIATIIDMYTECNWMFFGMLFIGVFDAIIRTEPEKQI